MSNEEFNRLMKDLKVKSKSRTKTRIGYHTVDSYRPVRDTIISKDEVINLIINLNSAKSFDEFLTLV